MLNVTRNGNKRTFCYLEDVYKYINRSRRFGGEYVFSVDNYDIEDNRTISKADVLDMYEAMKEIADKNTDLNIHVVKPTGIDIGEQTEVFVEEVETKTIFRMVDGYEVAAGEVVSGLDSAWKSGEQVVAEVKEIYKQVQEKKKAAEVDDFVKHFGDTPAIYHFEMAGMEVAYDSSEPCEWFGGRNYGVYTDGLKTGFHVVMYFVACNTDNIRLRYSIKDCHTGSFVVGAGNSAKAWKVDRRKPKQVFSVLGKIKAWLTKHGELAA